MTKTDILDAINRLLVERWPERTVYVDVCPVDFARPSFWLAVERHKTTDANRYLIRHDVQLRLTLYDELDEHYEASWYRLSQETDEAVRLLVQPLSVGTRYLTPVVQMLPRDPDRAYIQVNLSWMDERPGADAAAGVPAASDYTLRIQGDTN